MHYSGGCFLNCNPNSLNTALWRADVNETMLAWLKTKCSALAKHADWSHNHPAKLKLVIKNMQNGLEIMWISLNVDFEYGCLSHG